MIPLAHDLLAGAPLALIALTYLLNRALRRPSWRELLQPPLLSTGFLLWAATQFWPLLPRALLLNDIAIGLFVLDLFVIIARTPPTGMMQSEGISDPSGKIITFQSFWIDPHTGSETKVKVINTQVSDDKFTKEYFEKRRGKEVKTSEIIFSRAK